MGEKGTSRVRKNKNKILDKVLHLVVILLTKLFHLVFSRPMQVAGLLSHEQLSAIFLNVEELTEVNRQFTESLRDAIEIALDEGDEDLCTVKIGQIFKETEPMLSAFKSYCTRQVCINILFCHSYALEI